MTNREQHLSVIIMLITIITAYASIDLFLLFLSLLPRRPSHTIWGWVLNVNPAVSEQRPRCHNVTLKGLFCAEELQLVPRSNSKAEEGGKNEAGGGTYMAGIFCVPLFFSRGER